jgi:hypothetical protein
MDLGSARKARLFTGGTASWRRNGGAWSDADYDAWGAFANAEWRPRIGVALRAGYRLADRSFAQLTELDQLEQDAFASANVNLPSRTTLILESHFGWKSYAGAAPEVTPDVTSPPPATGGRGRGSGAHRAAVPSLVPAPASGGGEDAQQWNVLAHVAQGLAERTGAWARCFLRRTGGRVPPAIVVTPVGLFDDGVYDDPFASDLTALSAGAKHILAGGTTLRISGAWQRKDFTAVPALDADGSTLAGAPFRQDRVSQLSAGLALPAAEAHGFSMLLEIDYAFTRSRSNDVFHDYRDHVVGLTMTVHR